MSKEYEGQDPLVVAQQAERYLNSHGAKQGLSSSDTGMPTAKLLTITYHNALC